MKVSNDNSTRIVMLLLVLLTATFITMGVLV